MGFFQLGGAVWKEWRRNVNGNEHKEKEMVGKERTEQEKTGKERTGKEKRHLAGTGRTPGGHRAGTAGRALGGHRALSAREFAEHPE